MKERIIEHPEPVIATPPPVTPEEDAFNRWMEQEAENLTDAAESE